MASNADEWSQPAASQNEPPVKQLKPKWRTDKEKVDDKEMEKYFRFNAMPLAMQDLLANMQHRKDEFYRKLAAKQGLDEPEGSPITPLSLSQAPDSEEVISKKAMEMQVTKPVAQMMRKLNKVDEYNAIVEKDNEKMAAHSQLSLGIHFAAANTGQGAALS